jgi:hypothetical protein
VPTAEPKPKGFRSLLYSSVYLNALPWIVDRQTAAQSALILMLEQPAMDRVCACQCAATLATATFQPAQACDGDHRGS